MELREEATRFANRFLKEYHIEMTALQREQFIQELMMFRGAAQQSVQRTAGTPCLFHNIVGCSACKQLAEQSVSRR
jgi:hypothetical protein